MGLIFLSRSTTKARGTSRDFGTSIMLGLNEFKHFFAMLNAYSSCLVKLCLVTQTPDLIDLCVSILILKALLTTSAILTYLKLKFILTESPIDSTECQMPAGWYNMSPSFKTTSVHSPASLLRSYYSPMLTLLYAK